MNKLKQGITWLMFTGGLAYMAYEATFNHDKGFGNICSFLAVIGMISGMFNYVSDSKDAKNNRAKLRSKPRLIPFQMDATVDCLIGGLFLYHGWWITGICLIFQASCFYCIMESKEDEE